MTTEQISATTTIDSSPEVVFAVLADPSAHSAIDGTGWVRQPIDAAPLTGTGQVFRMAMYHENHPNKDYEMANTVVAFEPATAIAWEPGQEDARTGAVAGGGWVWRYDLAASGPSQTTVTLTYDWSSVAAEWREQIQFPPFPSEHLDSSLEHLSELVVS